MNDLSAEEMTQVAVYSNRHDAEVAKGMLEEVGIGSFVAADDVHPPLQITEGVKLMALRRDAAEARDALAQASMLAQSAPGAEGVLQGQYVREPGAASSDSIGETRRTTWLQKALLGVIVIAIAVGIVFIIAGVILS